LHRYSLLFSLTLTACDLSASPFPTEERIEAIDEEDAATVPPLYQYLYDSAFLPEVQYAEQRTRILIWLRHVEFYEHQLEELKALHKRATTLRERVRSTQQEIIQRFEPELVPAYNVVYEHLRAGGAVDDPALEEAARALIETRVHKAREDELLAVRLQSVRALLDEEQEFLRSLSAQQEIRFPDVVFVLRRDLDMASNPGDFKSLVGSQFSVGDPTLLLRGDFDSERKILNIGGLWSDAVVEDLRAPVLHEARRELLLYLLLQEPALPEAVDAALHAARVGGGAAPPAP